MLVLLFFFFSSCDVAHHSSLQASEPRILTADLPLCVWRKDSCHCFYIYFASSSQALSWSKYHHM